MACHIVENVDGEKRRRIFVTGRRKSSDPKENIGLRLPRSWRERIRERGKEQEFIEDAVREKMVRDGYFCNTDTV